MKKLANHPGFQLRDDAADSWNRFERDHGVRQVDSAYRSQVQQNTLIYRYAHPASKYDKPPYLYAPAAVSKHTSGVALDTPNAKALSAISKAYGWEFLYEYDAVHLEYNPAHDQHKGQASAPVVNKPGDPQKGKRATIKLGARGQLVQQLQDRLNGAHGFKLTRDAVFGPAVKRAVQAFQRSAGLTADGVVGPRTWGKLGL